MQTWKILFRDVNKYSLPIGAQKSVEVTGSFSDWLDENGLHAWVDDIVPMGRVKP